MIYKITSGVKNLQPCYHVWRKGKPIKVFDYPNDYSDAVAYVQGCQNDDRNFEIEGRNG
jgi:hypothetical protein